MTWRDVGLKLAIASLTGSGVVGLDLGGQEAVDANEAVDDEQDERYGDEEERVVDQATVPEEDANGEVAGRVLDDDGDE